MTPTETIKGASRPSRRLLIGVIIVWVVLALALPLAALTLNVVAIAGFPLGFWIAAQGALAGLAALALFFAMRARGTSSGEGLRPPLAFAAEALGAAGVIGFAGAIAALGFDGLALPLGLTAGLALMAIVIAPRFALYPVNTIAGFFDVRYGGRWPRRIAVIVTLLASVLLLAADLRGVALALQGLSLVAYAPAVALATALVAGFVIVRSFVVTPEHGPGAIAYVATLAALAIPLLALAVHHGSLPIPYFSYGQAMGDLAKIEQGMVASKLSNWSSVRPMTSPFLRLSMANFAGVVIALALGAAVLPHLLARHMSNATVTPGNAARRGALATAFVALFVMGLAALAVFARIGVADQLAKGIEVTAIPEALSQSGALGWANICDQAKSGLQSATEACTQMPGQRGFLRAQDINFSNDGFIVAAPWVSGAPVVAALALWLGLLLAAVVAGNAILSGAAEIVHAPRQGAEAAAGTGASNGFGARPAVTVIALSLLAAATVLIAKMEIPTLVSEAMALLAASLFPAILLGLYWRRMTDIGAIAAMLTGFLAVAVYIIGVRVFPVTFVELTGAWSQSGTGAFRKFALLQAAVSAATTDEAMQSASVALRAHALTMANWGGLKPAASVLFAVPLALVVGVIASLATPQARPKAS